jgi:hypothetical protein
MLLLGDVFGVLATLVGTFLTTLALILCLGLIFPNRARLSREALESSPGRAFGAGIVWLGLAGTGSLALIAMPSPAPKLLGTLALSFLTCVAALGAAGLAMIAAERIRRLDPNSSLMSGLTRGAAIVVGAGLFPVVGWFLVGPAIAIVGLGAGMKAVLSRGSALAEQAS